MQARLVIDLEAIADNWRALDSLTACETAAVVKADAYGLGVDRVGPALAAAGARSFFVALAEEGAALRAALGPGPQIFNFSGLMPGDEAALREADVIPLLNTPAQVAAAQALAASMDRPLPVGLQLDSGMNRLGLEPAELAALTAAPDWADGLDLRLAMSHLACADAPDHPMNRAQLSAFREMLAMIDGDVPASLAATGGILMGPDYHFDMTRPGVGLYGGMPFEDAAPVIRLTVPIIQIRRVEAGEVVGYGATWTAERPGRIATVAAGYADGLIRAAGGEFSARAGAQLIPAVGRVSMDLVTLDVTDAPSVEEGDRVEIFGMQETIDRYADAAGTIGYEILTSLGARYERRYTGEDL